MNAREARELSAIAEGPDPGEALKAWIAEQHERARLDRLAKGKTVMCTPAAEGAKPIEMIPVGKWFGVHWNDGEWIATHTPTGMIAVHAASRRLACAMAEAMERVPIDWDSQNPLRHITDAQHKVLRNISRAMSLASLAEVLENQ
jgi:hypothetical protein